MKSIRVILIVATALAIISCFYAFYFAEIKATYSQPAPPEGYGDINGDGLVSYDAENAYKHDFWLLYAFLDEYGPWDVNQDGITNGDDVNETQKFWTGSVNFTHLRADINWDDRVNVMDLWYILRFWNEMQTPAMTQERINQIVSHLNTTMLSPSEIMYRGDVDGDGYLTVYDVYLVIQYAKGAITEFPVEEGANLPPVAKLDKEIYDTSPYKETAFDASQSYDPDGSITGYRWIISNSSGNVYDSGYISSSIFTYTFPYPKDTYATYTLTLYVQDNDGAIATDSAKIFVWRGINQPPVAVLNQHEYYIDVGDTVTFDASASYDPEGFPITFNWYINLQPVYDDFGDYPTFTYTFDDPNLIDKAIVTVKVKDLAGDVGYDSAVVYINRTVYLNLTWSPRNPVVGDTVYFDASASYVEGATITGYSFTIDGKYSSGWKTSPYYKYTFYSQGEHSVRLTVMINDRVMWSKTWYITVSSPYEPSIIVEGEKIAGKTLTITVYYPYDAIDWINIDFGDGTMTSSPAHLNTNQYSFTHAYSRAGTYTIKANILTVSNKQVTLYETVEIKAKTSYWLYIAMGSIALFGISYYAYRRKKK